jgi:hypothetical protein
MKKLLIVLAAVSPLTLSGVAAVPPHVGYVGRAPLERFQLPIHSLAFGQTR